MQINGPDKKESRKVVFTKVCLCFYGKTKWKMKFGATKIQPNGSEKKEKLEKEVTTKI